RQQVGAVHIDRSIRRSLPSAAEPPATPGAMSRQRPAGDHVRFASAVRADFRERLSMSETNGNRGNHPLQWLVDRVACITPFLIAARTPGPLGSNETLAGESVLPREHGQEPEVLAPR